ncbi:branched-chain amino acid transport system ATP-binding protein [Rhodococcus sp. 27YEA15]|uniref:ABC transporter ATP-binding protein n=1 Tax=Rhodococcus sp. 27YEA15 TaxID=3156259 RepID=UPI003C7C3772
MTTVLEVSALTGGYNGLAVVRDVDLSVTAGRVMVLMGPNGAGKTTVLKTIAGIIPPMSGDIAVLGSAPSVRRPHVNARRGLAYVPDDRCLFRNLSARRNLQLAAHRTKTDIETVFEYLPELERILDRQAAVLSGGEQQMLAVARALLCQPKLLMIDELSMGLAPVIVERLLAVVRRIADDLGIGVLLVEQHVHLALGIADEAAILSHGRLMVSGRSEDVAAQAEEIEAGYLGATVT